MDAVEFFQTVNRLCKNPGCEGCPVCKDGMCMVMRMVRLDDVLDESIEETISKVEQWAKDNPIKTRQSEFLRLFPKAEIKDAGMKFIVDEAKKAPIIDPESLRFTAHWIKREYVCGENEYECSACHQTELRTSASRMKYCMFCGARMVNTDE